MDERGTVTIAQAHPGLVHPGDRQPGGPLAGTAHAPVDISWFFFGVGLLYWLALTPADPLPGDPGRRLPNRLQPPWPS